MYCNFTQILFKIFYFIFKTFGSDYLVLNFCCLVHGFFRISTDYRSNLRNYGFSSKCTEFWNQFKNKHDIYSLNCSVSFPFLQISVLYFVPPHKQHSDSDVFKGNYCRYCQCCQLFCGEVPEDVRKDPNMMSCNCPVIFFIRTVQHDGT